MKNILILSVSGIALSSVILTSFANSENTISHLKQQKILANAKHLSPQALKYAVKGYDWALKHHQINNKNILTIVNFNKPSFKKRLWVIDLKNDKVLMNLYTTQGTNSGRTYARHFSNVTSSHESSLGVYKTLSPFYGKHGLSEHIQGLEKGINNNANSRYIEVHPAFYASPRFVEQNHRAGNSWGCFAIDPAKSKKFISITKGGSVLYAYASSEKTDDVI